MFDNINVFTYHASEEVYWYKGKEKRQSRWISRTSHDLALVFLSHTHLHRQTHPWLHTQIVFVHRLTNTSCLRSSWFNLHRLWHLFVQRQDGDWQDNKWKMSLDEQFMKSVFSSSLDCRELRLVSRHKILFEFSVKCFIVSEASFLLNLGDN